MQVKQTLSCQSRLLGAEYFTLARNGPQALLRV